MTDIDAGGVEDIVRPVPKRGALERRYRLAVGKCPYCDAERRDNSNFHPPHDPSDHCESGRYAHCTCDRCF
jgi:hypothetical protein